MKFRLVLVLSVCSPVFSDGSSKPEPFKNPLTFIDMDNVTTNSIDKYYDDDDRIVGGYLAQPGQIPYQAGIYLYTANNQASICGGTLISNEWVMSAAHCTYRIVRAEVILGTVDITQRPPGSVRVWANFIRTHPNYRENSSKFDISLIRIPRVLFTNTIRSVYIAVSNGNSYVGQNVLVSGYGKTSDNTNTNRLYYTYTQIVNLNVCYNFYRPGLVDNSMLCARGPNNRPQSACRGDSGGPVFLNNVGVIGIISFGPDSCQRSQPEGYQRVNPHKTFIQQTTGLNFN